MEAITVNLQSLGMEVLLPMNLITEEGLLVMEFLEVYLQAFIQ